MSVGRNENCCQLSQHAVLQRLQPALLSRAEGLILNIEAICTKMALQITSGGWIVSLFDL